MANSNNMTVSDFKNHVIKRLEEDALDMALQTPDCEWNDDFKSFGGTFEGVNNCVIFYNQIIGE